MLIQTNRGLTCPERTCNELHYYEPNDALNSYGNSFFAKGSLRWPDARNFALHLAEERDYLSQNRHIIDNDWGQRGVLRL